MSPVVGVTRCSGCNSEPPLAGRTLPLCSVASAVLAPLRCCRMASWPTRWGAVSARFASLWHTVSAQARPRTWLCPVRPSQCSRTKPPVVRTTAFFGPCLFPVPPYCRPVSGDSSITGSPPRTLLGRVRAAVRARHYSPRTEASYVGWGKRVVVFHGRRHPDELGEGDVRAFLDHLAEHDGVSASTQNQAVAALLFLYEAVLGRALALSPQGIVHAKELHRLPVVLSREEVRAILAQLNGVSRLVGLLLYGSGLRLLECLRLRVKDVDFHRGEVRGRGGKGGVDRVVPLPLVVQGTLADHLARWRARHARDVQGGGGSVPLAGALESKVRGGAGELGGRWGFSAGRAHD